MRRRDFITLLGGAAGSHRPFNRPEAARRSTAQAAGNVPLIGTLGRIRGRASSAERPGHYPGRSDAGCGIKSQPSVK
jgi:hypothetical protein